MPTPRPSAFRAPAAALFGAPALACAFLAACAGAPAPADNDQDHDHATLAAQLIEPLRPRDLQSIFSPLDLPAPCPERTIRGEPGPAYWQNQADYRIDAQLDPDADRLRAACTITYTNRSPHTLDFLWLSLDQNLYRRDSDGAMMTRPGERFGNLAFDGGVEDLQARFDDGQAAPLEVHGTLARLDLPHPLTTGESATFRVDFAFAIPPYGSDRMGIRECKDGKVYELGQWFPQVCRFDDVHGWNTLPYLGEGEFYTDFGDYRVSVTAPSDFLVAATGALQNPRDVLDAQELERWERSQSSDEPVTIRSLADVDRLPVSSGSTRTWRFDARRVRSFGFAASRAFVWDACALRVADLRDPDGSRPPGLQNADGVFDIPERVHCQAFYPRESAAGWDTDAAGGGATRMLRDSVAHYSKRWIAYPYPCASTVSGRVAGMEYPQIIFCKADTDERELWGVITHEIGHSWFPMLVNSDERRHAWMDEGFNTFINAYADQERYENEPVRKWMRDFSRGRAEPLPQPVDTPPDALLPGMLGITQYDKGGLGLAILRESVLGPERFDRAFRAYIRRWAFKSPQPADYFCTIEDDAGVDLAWFLRGWYLETGVLDQAVTTVMQPEGESRNARVTIENRAALVFPVTMLVEYEDGSAQTRVLPVQIWQAGGGRQWQTTWDTSGADGKPRRVRRVTLDPDELLPDVRPGNNRWSR